MKLLLFREAVCVLPRRAGLSLAMTSLPVDVRVRGVL